MNELPRRSASSDSDAVAHDSVRSSQAGSGTFKSAPGRPVENAPALHRTRRLLLWLAALLALVTLGAFTLALKQPVTGSRWDPAPSIFSWNRFIAPREINSWKRPPHIWAEDLLETHFSPDGRSALAVGLGMVLRSADGGQRWREVAIATKVQLTSVAFALDGRSALAVGQGGTVLRSADGGQRWSEVASATKVRLSSVAFAPDGRGALAVGVGTVLRSADGGQRWSEVASTTKAWLWSVAFAPDGRSSGAGVVVVGLARQRSIHHTGDTRI